jgi:very-short-patch-repair endonuclease
MRKSAGEEWLYGALQMLRLPLPERQFRFHPKRKWQIDFCWPHRKLAVEIEGGVWSNGRHTRPQGFIKDMEKYNALSIMGYTLLRFTTQQVKSGMAINALDPLLRAEV